MRAIQRVREIVQTHGSDKDVARALTDDVFRDKLAAAERGFLLAALDQNRWQIAKTARELGLERSHLYKKMKTYGISRDDAK